MLRVILCATLLSAYLSVAASATDSEIRIGAASSRPEQSHLPSADISSVVSEHFASRSGANPTLLTRAVRVVPVDDKCTREHAIEVANALVAARVHVVIGHFCAPAAIAAAPVYAATGILFIAPGVRHPSLTTPRAGPLVFRLAGRNDRLAVDVARFLMRHYTDARVAVLQDQSARSREIATSLVRTLTTAGKRPALEEVFTSGEKTYAPLVRKLASQTIDVVFIPAQAPELTIMMRDAATLVPSMRFIGSDMLAIPYIEPVVAADSDRLILMLPWPDRSSFSDTASKPQHPTMAQSGEAMARLAIEIWAHAVAHAGSPDPEEIAPILTSQAAPTRAGPIRFDGHGDAEVPSYTPHVWRDGRWSPFEAQRP